MLATETFKAIMKPRYLRQARSNLVKPMRAQGRRLRMAAMMRTMPQAVTRRNISTMIKRMRRGG